MGHDGRRDPARPDARALAAAWSSGSSRAAARRRGARAGTRRRRPRGAARSRSPASCTTRSPVRWRRSGSRRPPDAGSLRRSPRRPRPRSSASRSRAAPPTRTCGGCSRPCGRTKEPRSRRPGARGSAGPRGRADARAGRGGRGDRRPGGRDLDRCGARSCRVPDRRGGDPERATSAGAVPVTVTVSMDGATCAWSSSTAPAARRRAAGAVDDDQAQVAAVHRHGHRDRHGTGMMSRVPDRLLDDPVGGTVERRVDRWCDRRVDGHRDRPGPPQRLLGCERRQAASPGAAESEVSSSDRRASSIRRRSALAARLATSMCSNAAAASAAASQGPGARRPPGSRSRRPPQRACRGARGQALRAGPRGRRRLVPVLAPRPSAAAGRRTRRPGRARARA